MNMDTKKQTMMMSLIRLNQINHLLGEMIKYIPY